MSLRDAPAAPFLEEVTDDDALEALAREWDHLLADSTAPSPFLTWAWVGAWRRTLGADHALAVVAARHPGDGRLVGLAPFAVEERRAPGGLGYRALVFLGSGPAAPDHLDLIVLRGWEATVAAPLWGAALRRARPDLADLDGLRAEGLLEALTLRRRADRRRYAEALPCPYLPLPATWEEYEASLGRNLRQNLRRYARRLEEESPGPVARRLVVRPEELDPTLDALARLHQQVRSARGQAGAFGSPALTGFHHLAARRFLEAGRLRLYRLDVAGKAVAVIYCIRQGEVVSFYTTGYDPAYARFGPGRDLMAHAIGAAIAEGAAEFDFLRGDESYKGQWGAQLRQDWRVVLPSGARGRLLLGGRNLLRPVRRVLGNRGRTQRQSPSAAM
ncbi:MAG: GNAT family N-acetyltransferase [Acidimicrobiia bacterium]|nr:GNAT family N-acetyltransferase [Acidimicrobiia bacterium]